MSLTFLHFNKSFPLFTVYLHYAFKTHSLNLFVIPYVPGREAFLLFDARVLSSFNPTFILFPTTSAVCTVDVFFLDFDGGVTVTTGVLTLCFGLLAGTVGVWNTRLYINVVIKEILK